MWVYFIWCISWGIGVKVPIQKQQDMQQQLFKTTGQKLSYYKNRNRKFTKTENSYTANM